MKKYPPLSNFLFDGVCDLLVVIIEQTSYSSMQASFSRSLYKVLVVDQLELSVLQSVRGNSSATIDLLRRRVDHGSKVSTRHVVLSSQMVRLRCGTQYVGAGVSFAMRPVGERVRDQAPAPEFAAERAYTITTRAACVVPIDVGRCI